MGQFDSSLLKAKDLIKFENDRSGKTFSSTERDQWDLKTIALIETTGDEWNKFQSDSPSDEKTFKIQFLTFQALAAVIRERVKNIKKQGPAAFWTEIEGQLQEFTHEKKLFPLGASLKILGDAIQSIEDNLTLTEWVIQTPRRWNFRWDAKENLDIKIDFLTNEIKNYNAKLDETLISLQSQSSIIGGDPFPWPHELEAIIILLKIGGIYKPKSLCANLPDPRLTATLLTDPKSCTTVLKQQAASSQRSLEDLKKKNDTLKQSLTQAKAMVNAGNYLKAEETLKQTPPTFRLSEQREILEMISKVKQRIAHIQAVHQKLAEMDLQKLDWSAIEEFCEEVHQSIHNYDENATDYEREALKLLHDIERYIKAHRKQVLIKWASLIGVTVILLIIAYFMSPKSVETRITTLEIKTSSQGTQWTVYNTNGDSIREGTGDSTLDVPREICYVVMKQGTRAALERVLWGEDYYRLIAQNTLFSRPQVRVNTLDSSGKNSLGREVAQLRVDHIPMPSDAEVLYIPKGIRTFSIVQQGQPDFDMTHMVTRRNEEITLISPWVPVDFDSNADDVFVSINNSTKRLVPYRFFLPVGNHEAIFTDSRGDIRETRRIHVEGGVENQQDVGVPVGALVIQIKPATATTRLVVNNITHTLKKGQRTLTISAGEQRIQVFQNGALVHESGVVVPVNDQVEKVISLP